MNLIPTPKQLFRTSGTNHLNSVAVVISEKCDRRVVHAAELLRNELTEKTNCFHSFSTTYQFNVENTIYISHKKDLDETYHLRISSSQIQILGNSAAGAFYGIQTLRQLIKEYGTDLPCIQIEDYPSFKERGLYQDVSRGRVPTLSSLKKLVDQLSLLKQNELQLYVEDTFWNEENASFQDQNNCLTAAEIMELDDYCFDHFIELVPSMSTFGHLYNLLQNSKFSEYCEFENWEPKRLYWIEKMEHHTIDVYHPGSFNLVQHMIEQYLPLFRSSKFNICCDETFDLCKGKNAEKDSGTAYYTFVLKIIDLIKSHGKTVQMWGDIVLNHQEQISLLPKDTVLLNWCYSKEPREDWVNLFEKSGLKQIVCPGTASWNHWVPDLDTACSNIREFAVLGDKYHAAGIINTNWGDFGSIGLADTDLYPIAYGAEQSWNPGINQMNAFNSAVDLQLFSSGISNVLWQLSDFEKAASWSQLVNYVSARVIENKAASVTFSESTFNAVKKPFDVIEDFPENNLSEVIAISAEGISITARLILSINHKSYDSTLKSDLHDFLNRYEILWNRQNKSSEFWRIKDFMFLALSLTEKLQ